MTKPQTFYIYSDSSVDKPAVSPLGSEDGEVGEEEE